MLFRVFNYSDAGVLPLCHDRPPRGPCGRQRWDSLLTLPTGFVVWLGVVPDSGF
jgi:hypothetical protein